MNKSNPFEQIKFHPSSVGELMTSLPGLTDVQLSRCRELLTRNAQANAGEAKPLTTNMANELDTLLEKQEGKDELPVGAISKLEAIYNEVVWGRRPIVETRYMDKGNLMEQDCLDLVSKYDGKFYKKNREKIENDFLIGTPDVIDPVIDTKACWDMDTFTRAKVSKTYEWQVKGYCWILGQESGRLAYCLVNTPGYLITSEKNHYWYKYGQPEHTNESWMEMARQIERNMIFDWDQFRKDNENYDLDNKDDYPVPMHFRVKQFEITLEEKDIQAFKVRLQTCREWLKNKYEVDRKYFV